MVLKLFVGRELDRVLPTGWTWNWQIQPLSPVTNIYNIRIRPINCSHQIYYSTFNKMIGGKLTENFINNSRKDMAVAAIWRLKKWSKKYLEHLGRQGEERRHVVNIPHLLPPTMTPTYSLSPVSCLSEG